MGAASPWVTVMRQFPSLIRRFGRDERGAFAAIFGLMAIVLVALGGAVVDYVSLQQMRNRGQIALDAAALALQPEIFKNPIDVADIKKRAQDLMLDRLAGEHGVVAGLVEPTVDVVNGTLTLEAEMTVPTVFVALVGVHEMNARITSQATRKKLALEVMMVLDNSGSMDKENRMDYLQLAAKCATNTLFYSEVIDDPANSNSCVKAPAATKVEEVKMGVVPFTMFVNVGPGNATQSWIDKLGNSPVSAHNFDTDDDDSNEFVGPLNRLELFNNLANERWRGCVEARPHTKSDPLDPNRYLDTDDTPATSADPKTLYVPMFSPDLPYGYGGQSYISDEPAACKATGTCVVVTTENSCSYKYGNCSSTNTTRTLTGKNTGSNPTCTCNNTPSTNESTSSNNWGTRYNRTRTWTCSVQYDPQGLSVVEKLERVCKYSGASFSSGFSKGPNADCTREAILPLTNDPASVINKITAMQAEGGTNIHEGAAWGFRALSPGEPFAEGSEYEEATNKVLIIMTDGENTAYNLPHTGWQTNYCDPKITDLTGSCYYSAYGWPRNDSMSVPRLGPMGTANSNLVNQMNERTSQTCENAKARGIVVYTIGLSTDAVSQSSPTVVQTMLRNCASSPDRAHLPTSPSQLKSVFARIANELAALRLSQ